MRLVWDATANRLGEESTLLESTRLTPSPV